MQAHAPRRTIPPQIPRHRLLPYTRRGFFFEVHAHPCTIPPSSRTIGCFPKAIPFLPLFNFNFLGKKDRIAYEALEDVALAIQDKMTQKSTFGPAGYVCIIYIYIYSHTRTRTHTHAHVCVCVCVCIYIYIIHVYTHT